MSELFAKGGEWKQTLPPWTEAELQEMAANGGVCTQKSPDWDDAETVAPEPAAAAPAAPAPGDLDGMTNEERLAYLRKRGVQIETHEERVAAARGRVDAVPLRGEGEFVYLKIPAAIGEPVRRNHGPCVDGDALLTVLKPAFADTAVLDAKTVERETSEKLANMCGSANLKAPSLATMQKLGNEGGVEAYPLARGDAKNGFRNVALRVPPASTRGALGLEESARPTRI